MKSKYNPFVRRSLALAALLTLIAPAANADNSGNYDWTGGASSSPYNFTDSANWGGTWDQWSDYRFGGTPTGTSATINDFFGIGSITLQSGLTTDIVINSSQANPVIMSTGQAGGTSASISIAAGSSNLTINGRYIVGASPVTWDVGAGRTLTLNGPLEDWYGNASLVKNGEGTAVLNGASSYTGATTINKGTLKLEGAAFSTTARAYTIASGAVMNLVGNADAASGTTTIDGGGTLRIGGGTLKSGADGRDLTMALGSGALIEIQSDASILNGGWQNMTWTNNLAGMQVDGALDLNDGNPVIIDALTGSGTVTKTNWTQDWIDTRTLTVGKNNGSGTFSGIITQSGASQVTVLTKEGTGTQTLTGANDYRGVTNINAGTLLAANNTALGAGGFNGTALTYINDGATLALQGGISLDEHFHVWGSGVDSLGAVRSISGNNALTSSYLGGAGYALRSNTTVGVDADTLSISGFYEDSAGLSLTKVGAGALRLTGTSSGYTGGTMINEGTIIAGAGGVAKGAVTIASGATLATTSATSTGLAALYYNNAPVQANIANLPTLLNHFGANSPVPSLVQTATSMNFGNNGSGFPSPYNSGAISFEAFYSGKINIATAGTYTFNTSSDDGSMLFIDGVAVVTNNFDQPLTTQSGSIALSAGMHDIVIAYNQGAGGYGMNTQMSGADDTNMVDINTANASITPDLVVGSLTGAGNVTLTTGNLITGIDNTNTSFNGAISGIGSVTKFGTGVQTLTGTLSYGGSTSVEGGTLAVVGSLPAASTVTVGSGGTLNPGTVGATGILNAGTTNIVGTLAIDLDAASSDRLAVTGNLDISGSTLAINPLAVPAATPYTIATYSGTLTGSFVSPPSGYTVNYGTRSNSAITLTKSSSDYDTWGGPYGLATGSESGDLDNDGVTNFEEYAFGLVPNSGSSLNPIASQLNKSTKTFSYTRRNPSLGTNLTYSVWFSENLVGWTKDTGATDGTPVPIGDNETVEVTLSTIPGDPLPAKLFIQVRAN